MKTKLRLMLGMLLMAGSGGSVAAQGFGSLLLDACQLIDDTRLYADCRLDRIDDRLVAISDQLDRIEQRLVRRSEQLDRIEELLLRGTEDPIPKLQDYQNWLNQTRDSYRELLGTQYPFNFDQMSGAAMNEAYWRRVRALTESIN